jgi:DNA-binding Xre family transcriptional regulator
MVCTSLSGVLSAADTWGMGLAMEARSGNSLARVSRRRLKFRHVGVRFETLEAICKSHDCHLGDILEYASDPDERDLPVRLMASFE